MERCLIARTFTAQPAGRISALPTECHAPQSPLSSHGDSPFVPMGTWIGNARSGHRVFLKWGCSVSPAHHIVGPAIAQTSPEKTRLAPQRNSLPTSLEKWRSLSPSMLERASVPSLAGHAHAARRVKSSPCSSVPHRTPKPRPANASLFKRSLAVNCLSGTGMLGGRSRRPRCPQAQARSGSRTGLARGCRLPSAANEEHPLRKRAV